MYAVISTMLSVWRDELNTYNNVIYERFVGTQTGLFTMYPATQLNDTYDHMLTDWFNLAMAHKDRLVFTPPRSNEFSRCDVITIAHTLLEGKYVTSRDGNI